MAQVQTYQIPSVSNKSFNYWIVENIGVILDKATNTFKYILLIWNEDTADWEHKDITRKEAEELCLVELPKKFYE